LQTCNAPEVIIAGPSETGKTVAVLAKADASARAYPGAQIAVLRKVYATVVSTIQQTYERRILVGDRSVTRYGGEEASWYDYSNGSRVWFGGMDNADKVLGGERDLIIPNQAEQFSLNDWEYLTTRATGRAGNVPYPQVLGDCNPAGSLHWILQRPRLLLLHSRHEDNPALFDDAGHLTEQGRRTLETLEALTGARKQRLFHGRWAQSEGVVFAEEFGEDNLTGDEPDPNLPIELAADDGYHPDPRVILFIQRTPTRILVFDEMFHTRHLAQTCVQEAVARCGERFGWKDTEKTQPVNLPELCIGGTESKELSERMRLAGIPYRGATHPITEGIEVLRRLFRDANGYRLVKIHKRCTNLISELTDGYQYPSVDQKHSKLDTPVDANNHGIDALRYWTWKRAR
jgi:phage terminase large subunit